MRVWVALSELFLDTSLDGGDYYRIAHVLSVSPYSTEKIEDILRYEVSPVCQWNLLAIAGEWAGFNKEWLREKIIPRLDRRPRFHMRVWWPKPSLPLGWKAVRKDLEEIRLC